MKEADCFEKVIFSKEIERPVMASDQPVKQFTRVEVIVRKDSEVKGPYHIRIIWDYYDVHATGSSDFTIPFYEFENAVRKLRKFQEYFESNKGIEQEIHGVTAFTQARPHLMWSNDLNKMLFTDRDFGAHLQLFDEVLQVVEKEKVK